MNNTGASFSINIEDLSAPGPPLGMPMPQISPLANPGPDMPMAPASPISMPSARADVRDAPISKPSELSMPAAAAPVTATRPAPLPLPVQPPSKPPEPPRAATGAEPPEPPYFRPEFMTQAPGVVYSKLANELRQQFGVEQARKLATDVASYVEKYSQHRPNVYQRELKRLSDQGTPFDDAAAQAKAMAEQVAQARQAKENEPAKTPRETVIERMGLQQQPYVPPPKEEAQERAIVADMRKENRKEPPRNPYTPRAVGEPARTFPLLYPAEIKAKRETETAAPVTAPEPAPVTQEPPKPAEPIQLPEPVVSKTAEEAPEIKPTVPKAAAISNPQALTAEDLADLRKSMPERLVKDYLQTGVFKMAPGESAEVPAAAPKSRKRTAESTDEPATETAPQRRRRPPGGDGAALGADIPVPLPVHVTNWPAHFAGGEAPTAPSPAVPTTPGAAPPAVPRAGAPPTEAEKDVFGLAPEGEQPGGIFASTPMSKRYQKPELPEIDFDDSPEGKRWNKIVDDIKQARKRRPGPPPVPPDPYDTAREQMHAERRQRQNSERIDEARRNMDPDYNAQRRGQDMTRTVQHAQAATGNQIPGRVAGLGYQAAQVAAGGESAAMAGGAGGLAIASLQLAGDAAGSFYRTASRFANDVGRFDGQSFTRGLADAASKIPILGNAASAAGHALLDFHQTIISSTERLAPFNPRLMQQVIGEEMRQLRRDIDRARNFGDQYSRRYAQATEVNRQMDDLMDRLQPLFLDAAGGALALLTSILDGLKAMADAINNPKKVVEGIGNSVIDAVSPMLPELAAIRDATEETAGILWKTGSDPTQMDSLLNVQAVLEQLINSLPRGTAPLRPSKLNIGGLPTFRIP